MKILLVDDDNFSRKLMGMYLKSLQAQVNLVASGQECLDQVAQDAPSLILMDCQMPDMDGYEATTRLRESGYSGIILALTANSDEATLERCRSCGMNGHISKPVNAQTLQERILSALSGNPDPNDSTASAPLPASPPISTPISEEPASTAPASRTEASVASGGASPSPESESGFSGANPDFSGEQDPLARLRALTMGGRNTAIFNRLLTTFVKSIDESVAQLTEAVRVGDAAGVVAASHRIRGSAGSFGATPFSEQAGNVEDVTTASGLAESRTLAQDLIKYWGPLRSYLESAGGNP